MNRDEIKTILPHRDSMLLLDSWTGRERSPMDSTG